MPSHNFFIYFNTEANFLTIPYISYLTYDSIITKADSVFVTAKPTKECLFLLIILAFKQPEMSEIIKLRRVHFDG
jgi:hypothetical protein